MNNVIELKNEKVNIEKLEKQLDREMAEADAVAKQYELRANNGKGAKDIGEAQKIWETMTRPGKTRKKIAKEKGIEVKTTEESLEELLEKSENILSEREMETGLLTTEHLEKLGF